MSKEKGVKIGLETHVQLDTDSKLFCSCSNSPSEVPNTNVCEICLGMPGSKPSVNKKAINYSLKAAISLGCEVNTNFFFSRKTYFYPDMSKDYQITQYEIPMGEDGEIELDGRTIGIKRVHLEEDPAKLVHKGGTISESKYTLVDYNRSGTPLIEVVTKPDLKSPKEARKFLQKLTRILEYLKIYDLSSELTIRTDANISLEGGARVEVKNITGTKAIERALSYEIRRHKNLKERGREVERETRSYDQERQVTTPLRKKEAEEDYGYIFEPDLSGFEYKGKDIERMKEEIPELPDQKLERFVEEYGLKEEIAKSLITDLELGKAFEEVVEEIDPDTASSWFTDHLKKTLNYHGISFSRSGIKTEWIIDLLEELKDDKISERSAEKVTREMVEKKKPPMEIIEEKGLERTQKSELSTMVSQVLKENPDAVEDWNQGKDEAINFLVGKVMQKSKGQADPKETRELILQELE